MEKIIMVSESKILRSAAGYYIGRDCAVSDGTYTWYEPYSRESGYFADEEQAEKMLALCW